jgi:hypothetical protein
MKDLKEAIDLYVEKRDHLRALCLDHKRELSSWLPLSRQTQGEGRKIQSVYKHDDINRKIINPNFSHSSH